MMTLQKVSKVFSKRLDEQHVKGYQVELPKVVYVHPTDFIDLKTSCAIMSIFHSGPSSTLASESMMIFNVEFKPDKNVKPGTIEIREVLEIG
jgi:hypothetical protein